MIKFYFQKTINSLQNLGIVGVSSMLCVSFGVLSVYSLISLSNEIKSVFQADPQIILGGDVEVLKTSPLEPTIEPDPASLTGAFGIDFENLQGLESYTPILSKNYPNYRLESKQKTFSGIHTIQAVDSQKFPLYGNYKFKPNQDLSSMIKEEGSVVIPANFAQANDLSIGDSITIISDDNFSTQRLIITGIILDSAAKSSSSWFVSYQTFLSGFDLNGQGASLSILLKGKESVLENQLSNIPGAMVLQKASQVQQVGDNAQKIFNIGLNGSSVLGLFIGGLGIATSIQIILNRRRKEVATLKTLGYKTGHILLFFLGEVFLLAIIGSGLGLILGVIISYYFIQSIQKTGGTFQLSFEFQPFTALIAVITSLLTTVAFTTVIVWQNSKVKPAVVFRDFQETNRFKNGLVKLGLLIPILFVFFLISTFLTESWEVGLGSLLLAFLGTTGAGTVFWIVFFLLTKIPLPLPGIYKLSWVNLKQNFSQSIIAVVAIFAGVTVLGFAVIIFDNANDQLNNQKGDKSGWNVLAYVPQKHLDEFDKQIQNSEKIKHSVNYPRAKVQVERNEISQNLILEGLDSSQKPPFRESVELSADSQLILAGFLQNEVELDPPPNPYFGRKAPNPGFSWEKGQEMKLQINSQTTTKVVTGFFEQQLVNRFLQTPNPDLVLPEKEYLQSIPEADSQKVYWLETKPEDITPTVESLSQIDQSIIIYDLISIEQATLENYRNIVTFALSVASLSLLAGLILMLNSILLVMVQRKKEFGILKAIGYSNSQVRNIVWLEYLLMGLVISFLAIIVDYAGVRAINHWEPEAELIYKPIYSLITIILTLLIVFLATFLSSRKTLQVKPMEILRYE